MSVPFHRVRACGPIVVAARGASLHTFSAADGTHIAAWRLPQPAGEEKGSGREAGKDSPAPVDHSTPPSKRRKLEGGAEAAAAKARAKPDHKKKPAGVPAALRSADLPVVSILETTADGQHVIVVMGHDKTVRVLTHDQGRLEQISERIMPKRPSAVAMSADGQTILVGDKFGDVYGLPLIESAAAAAAEAAETASSLSPPVVEAAAATVEATPLKLEANRFTVHTKGNLQALENQRLQKARDAARQKEQQQQQKEQQHRLLLGHVSMLTAVAAAEPAPGRPLILTADRDEHIRVTRGAPSQTHVIETFCLGHTAFVSRLCIAAGRGDRLVSGGGEGDLRAWAFWPAGRLLSTAPVQPLVADLGLDVGGAGGAGDENSSSSKLAVSGIYSFGESQVVAFCERVPALFFFRLADGDRLEHTESLRLPGLPLDLGVIESADNSNSVRLAVAVAVADEKQDESSDTFLLVVAPSSDGSKNWAVSDTRLDAPALENSSNIDTVALRQSLLYSTESLRKTTDEGGE